MKLGRQASALLPQRRRSRRSETTVGTTQRITAKGSGSLSVVFPDRHRRRARGAGTGPTAHLDQDPVLAAAADGLAAECGHPRLQRRGAWPDALGVGKRAVLPLLFLVAVESARHAIGRMSASRPTSTMGTCWKRSWNRQQLRGRHMPYGLSCGHQSGCVDLVPQLLSQSESHVIVEAPDGLKRRRHRNYLTTRFSWGQGTEL